MPNKRKKKIFPLRGKKQFPKNEIGSSPDKHEVEIVFGDRAFTEIRFDYKTNLFFAALAIYLLVTTCFNINGSSVGMWNEVFSQKPDPQILFGTPKEIRSDEWAMHTPAILSQCNSKTPFSTENYSLGGYKAPLVMNVPVKHFSTLLRPQFWLFFLLGTEKAFAFYWNMKLVMLVGGIFLLLMLLLENNFILSVFGALWVYFSGYMQWWYSSPCEWPELVGCFALFTTALIISLTSKRKIVIVAASILFIASFLNFVVSLYPPHQVPLVYLSFCLVLGMLLPRFRSVRYEILINRFRLFCVLLTLLVTAALLFLCYWDARQTLEVFANTVYPGQRRTTGGGISIAQIFDGFIGFFMSEKNFPAIWSNVCESSNFLLLFPIPMMLMCWKWFQQKKVNVLETVLAIYITIILFWIILGFPEPIARFTLFDRVGAARAFLALGIASIIWTCLSLHLITRDKTTFTWKFKSSITTIMLIGVLLLSLYFNSVTGDFASVYQIIIVCGFVSVAGFIFISRQPLLFAGLILLPNIYFHGMINPICVGLKPIIEHPLYKKINTIAHQEPDSKWIAYGGSVPLLANFAYAAGANVFNGLKYIPNLEEMKELSTKKHDIEIYNRYSYITLLPVKGSEIGFSLSSSIDHYMIAVDPGNDCWKKLSIHYYLVCSEDGIHLFKYKSE